MKRDEQTNEYDLRELNNEEIRAKIKIGELCYMCGSDVDSGKSIGRKRMCRDCILDDRDAYGIPKNKT